MKLTSTSANRIGQYKKRTRNIGSKTEIDTVDSSKGPSKLPAILNKLGSKPTPGSMNFSMTSSFTPDPKLEIKG
jgi:hypothetical protein